MRGGRRSVRGQRGVHHLLEGGAGSGGGQAPLSKCGGVYAGWSLGRGGAAFVDPELEGHSTAVGNKLIDSGMITESKERG